MEIPLDTDPTWPKADSGGVPLVIPLNARALFQFGLFQRGAWITVLPWQELWMEIRPMTTNRGAGPAGTSTALFSLGTAIYDTTLAYFQAYENFHGTISMTAAQVNTLSVGTYWMSFSVATSRGDEEAAIGGGTISVIAAYS
jgi:hypothetical protein